MNAMPIFIGWFLLAIVGVFSAFRTRQPRIGRVRYGDGQFSSPRSFGSHRRAV